MEVSIGNIYKPYECILIHDINTLSLSKYEHINIIGKCSFKLSEEIRKCMLISLIL